MFHDILLPQVVALSNVEENGELSASPSSVNVESPAMVLFGGNRTVMRWTELGHWGHAPGAECGALPGPASQLFWVDQVSCHLLMPRCQHRL